jgi:hypothetical protein
MRRLAEAVKVADAAQLIAVFEPMLELGSVQVPVTLWWGEQDRVIQPLSVGSWSSAGSSERGSRSPRASPHLTAELVADGYQAVPPSCSPVLPVGVPCTAVLTGAQRTARDNTTAAVTWAALSWPR